MDFASKHLWYVAAAYGLSATVLGGLVLWAVLRDRALRARLEERKEP